MSTSHAELGATFSHNDKLLATSGDDARVVIWNTSTYSKIHSLCGHTESVRDIAFTHDDSRIITTSYDETARVWDVHTGALLLTLNGTASVVSAAFSPDGALIATGGGDGAIHVFNAQGGEKSASMKGHSEPVNVVLFSPDGKSIASGSGDCFLRLWDVHRHSLTQSIESPSEVRALTYTPSGDAVVVGGYNGTSIVYSLTGEVLHEFGTHTKPVHGVSFPVSPSSSSSSAPATPRRISKQVSNAPFGMSHAPLRLISSSCTTATPSSTSITKSQSASDSASMGQLASAQSALELMKGEEAAIG